MVGTERTKNILEEDKVKPKQKLIAKHPKKVELIEITKEMSEDKILKNLLVALKKQGFKIKGEFDDEGESVRD